MKPSLRLHLLKGSVLLALLSFTFCNKVNDIIGHWPDCEVRQYIYSRTSTQAPYLYQKRYDASGKFLQEISVTFNGVGIRPLQHLSIRSFQKRLLLINTSNPLDTAYTVEFNSFGRPQTIAVGQGYSRFQLSFSYKNSRLDSIKFPNSVFYPYVCYYDSKGNITSIKSYVPEYGQYQGSFYEYDYSRTAKNQVYFNEVTGDALHPFILLRYLDLFPELNPTNIRTRASTGLENVYYLSRDYLINHQFDADGKLISFDASPAPDAFSSQVFIDWKCNRAPNQESEK